MVAGAPAFTQKHKSECARPSDVVPEKWNVNGSSDVLQKQG